jgi:hypothetical protein
MRRVKWTRTKPWMLLACGVVAGAFALALWGEKEPVYSGKKLSGWLSQYCGALDSSNQQKSEEAANAVRHIGVSGLPCLVHWMDCDTPRLERRAADLLPKWLGGTFVTGFLDQREFQQAKAQGLAILGFEILAKDARPAVPELVRLVRGQRADNAEAAMCALGFVGEEGLAALVTVVTNRNFPLEYQCWAVFTIGGMGYVGTNAIWVVPILATCLQDAKVAEYAAYALGGLGLQSEVAVPALAQRVQSSDQGLRRVAIWSLGLFGKKAVAAIPVLLPALTETEWKATPSAANSAIRLGEMVGEGSIAEVATNALVKIAPEVLGEKRDEDMQFLNLGL